MTAGPSEVCCGPWSIAGFLSTERTGGRPEHLSSPPAAGAAMRSRREKVFGPGRAVPLDGNAKARIQAYARAWSGRNRSRANTRVRSPAPSWTSCRRCSGASTTPDRRLLPHLRRIAEKAECARSTVAEALKVLELAGVLSWQHRLTRIREGCTDLFGHHGWRWRVIRTSNAYVFSDPKAAVSGGFASKSENPTGTLNQEIPISRSPTSVASDSPLERALARFGAVISKQDGIEQGSGA